MMFPPEIIDKILSYVDYDTLKAAAQVHPDWRQIIYNDAERRCRRDIPASRLLDLQLTWTESYDSEGYWVKLYDTWYSWQDITENVEFTSEEFKAKIGSDIRITCFACLGDYVAVGLKNGFVKVYDRNGKLKGEFNHWNEERAPDEKAVGNIHFIADPVCSSQPKQILSSYKDAIFLNDCQNLLAPAIILPIEFHTESFSVYKDYFALITRQDELLIIHASAESDDATEKSIKFVTVVSLTLGQSWKRITYRKTALSEETCYVVICGNIATNIDTSDGSDRTLRMIKYKDTYGKSNFIDKKLSFMVDYYDSNEYLGRAESWKFYNESIIAIFGFESWSSVSPLSKLCCLNTHESNFLEYSWSYYNWIGKGIVRVVYLHGNILVLGTDVCLLFYNVNDWKEFNIEHYVKNFILPVHFGVIQCIEVIEKYGECIFYVCSDKKIYTVIGSLRRNMDGRSGVRVFLKPRETDTVRPSHPSHLRLLYILVSFFLLVFVSVCVWVFVLI